MNETLVNNFNNVGIQVDILKPENFLVICESLTRIGIAKESEKKLFQSCHIVHKIIDGNSIYRICHFKEMFLLNGKKTDLTDHDLDRRDVIILLLEKWGLIKILQMNLIDLPEKIPFVKVLPHSQKKDWQLIKKYTFKAK